MIKQVWLFAVMATLFMGAALAQGPARGAPSASHLQSTEDCIQHASELAELAETKDMTEDKIDLIEDLLTRMEGHCDAKQFDDALALARQIQNAIDSD